MAKKLENKLITLKQKLTAIKGSIEKWDKVSKGDKNTLSCPLCVLYDSPRNGCVGCPIYEKTGEAYCRGTLYSDYLAEQELHGWSSIKRAKVIARKFRDWLKDLYIEVSERELEELVLDLKGLFHQEEDYAVGVKRLQDAVNELNKTKPIPNFVEKTREAEKAEPKDKQDESLMPIWMSISQLENKIKKFKDSHNFTHIQLEEKCDAIWERAEDIGDMCKEGLKKTEKEIQLLKHHKEVTRIELDHHARAILSLEELNKK